MVQRAGLKQENLGSNPPLVIRFRRQSVLTCRPKNTKRRVQWLMMSIESKNKATVSAVTDAPSRSPANNNTNCQKALPLSRAYVTDVLHSHGCTPKLP